MIITNEELTEIFPKVIGGWKRIFTSRPFDVEEMIADTVLYSDFENVRDIVLYANDNLTIKGIIVEFIQGKRFVYSPITCDAVFPNKEVGTIEKMINGEGNWGYESLDKFPIGNDSYREVQTDSIEELKELTALFIAKLKECNE
ncbi:hypothetical protein [Bacillus toyonensis]|uniref:hypothetical protein n=1 Tax=Bacillus toyonensis TaxID=155322 RepID=UPI002E1EF279|nr:hypothetical protein [Bacillus toyonensis]